MPNVHLSEVEPYYGNGFYKKFMKVDIDTYTFYFSYETIVAYETPETGLVVSENIWSVTTGRHLNSLNSKEDRILNKEFDKQVTELMHKIRTHDTYIMGQHGRHFDFKHPAMENDWEDAYLRLYTDDPLNSTIGFTGKEFKELIEKMKEFQPEFVKYLLES